jgi:hypothetical protein
VPVENDAELMSVPDGDAFVPVPLLKTGGNILPSLDHVPRLLAVCGVPLSMFLNWTVVPMLRDSVTTLDVPPLVPFMYPWTMPYVGSVVGAKLSDTPTICVMGATDGEGDGDGEGDPPV